MDAKVSDSKFVTVEGVRLHYQDVGSGYPLICIHGAGPGASAESNFKLNAAAFAEKFRVILYDMPQYGKSSRVVLTEPRLQYNARILNGFMAALGIDQAHIGATQGFGAHVVLLHPRQPIAGQGSHVGGDQGCQPNIAGFGQEHCRERVW